LQAVIAKQAGGDLAFVHMLEDVVHPVGEVLTGVLG